MENNWTDKSDPDLVTCWQDDPESLAAAELLGRYQRRVYRWCYRYVQDHDRALDLAQDVLLTALEKINTLRSATRFATWLFVLTRNCCLSEMRKQKVRAVEDVDVEVLPAKTPTPETDFLERVSAGQLLATMESALETAEQEAICLRCFEKMPVDSITKVLGVSEQSGARGLLQRARRKLKAALIDQGFDFSGAGGTSP